MLFVPLVTSFRASLTNAQLTLITLAISQRIRAMNKITRNFAIENEDQGIKKFLCKECGKATNHLTAASYREDGSESVLNGRHSVDWTERHQIIQCQGCETVSFRVVSSNSEDWDHDPETGDAYLNETEK